MEEIGPRLNYVCQRYASDELSSEDILQESLIQIFSKLKQFDPEKGNFFAWCKTVTIRIALRLLQQNRKFVYTDISEVHSEEVSYTPNDALSTQELQNLVDEIEEPQRTIFNLYCIEGYSHQEIAELLKINESTCRSYLRRTKLKLQSEIEKLELVG